MRDHWNNNKIVSMSPALFSQLSQRTEKQYAQNIPPNVLRYRLEFRSCKFLAERPIHDGHYKIRRRRPHPYTRKKS